MKTAEKNLFVPYVHGKQIDISGKHRILAWAGKTLQEVSKLVAAVDTAKSLGVEIPEKRKNSKDFDSVCIDNLSRNCRTAATDYVSHGGKESKTTKMVPLDFAAIVNDDSLTWEQKKEKLERIVDLLAD